MTAPSFTSADAERYLASLELFGMRFGLERMRRLMTALDSPQERFASIHVVGTNGKSSTARMTAALLGAHGVGTGAYLSPHLTSFAERVEVAGTPAAPERFAAAISRAARAAALVDRTLEPGDRVTQFEALTAAAYWELARAGVDAAVIEAGLGGRYDATSVITSSVQVITTVGLEHTRWLGPTERHIAEEKLAIVPEGGVLVAGRLGAQAAAVAEAVTSERRASLTRLGAEIELELEGGRLALRTPHAAYRDIELAAPGGYQRENFALAVAAAEAFLDAPLESRAVKETAARLRIPGRLDVVGRDPLIVLDGAHNPSGARALRASLAEVTGRRPVTAVFSILSDKDAAGMLGELMPVCTGAVFTRSSHRDALPPATLESLWRQLGGGPAEIHADPLRALEAAAARAGRTGAVLVTGSIYLLSDLARARTGRRAFM